MHPEPVTKIGDLNHRRAALRIDDPEPIHHILVGAGDQLLVRCQLPAQGVALDPDLGSSTRIRPVQDDPTAGLIPIGEFARRARLTHKALRLYDRTGLLRPALTDEATGYRRYDATQVRTGQLISLLRGAGLSLADVECVLRDVAAGRPGRGAAGTCCSVTSNGGTATARR